MTILRATNVFLERSIAGALSFMKESVFSDDYAARRGLLQSIDPRVKLAAILIFIAAVLFAGDIASCLVLYAACLTLARLSSVGIVYFLKRTWIFIPMFSLFIAVPAIFSVFTPGEPVAAVGVFGLSLKVTRQGLTGAALFVCRVTASVSFAVLLSLTTRHFVLLRALRAFRIPQVFVMVLGMCYRYIYLLIEVIENTYIAIKSRVGRRIGLDRAHRIVAWNIASLWYRSYRLNEAVYESMVARGFTGEPVIEGKFSSSARDWIFLCGTALICALALVR